MCCLCTSIGRIPAVCAASTTRRRPFAPATAETAARSVTFPVTLEAWVITIALVFSRTEAASAAASILPSPSTGTTESATPSFSSR